MRIKSRGAVWVGGLFLALSVQGCNRGGVGTIYRAERDLWRTARLEKTLRIVSDTAPPSAETGRVLSAYGRILTEYPAIAGGSPDTAAMHGIGRVRAQALMGVIRMHRLRNEPVEVRQRLDEARKAFPWDLNLTLRFHQELAQELRSSGDLESAARLYQEMAASLPARRANGEPLIPVQDAPIQAADIFRELGRQDEATAELDRAEAYYRSLIQSNPDDPAATLAWLELGTVATRRGQFEKATEMLEKARKSPGAVKMEPRILLILGTLQQEARKNPGAAVSVFSELVERFPDDPVTPEALVRRAAALADLDRIDEALASLQKLKESYARDRATGAKGELLAARILVHAQRWPEALSRYRALMADYPTSPEAIGVPFEVETHYREIGETEAAANTMERAIEQFGELRDAYPGTAIAWTADESTARAMLRLGRLEEAVTKLTAMPDLYPRDPRDPLALLQAAGIASERMKDRARAADILDQLATRYPQSSLAAKAQEEAARLRGK